MNNSNFKNRTTMLPAVLRIFFLGLAFIGTVWMIAMLNSGSVFTPGSPTATLLGIRAQKGR